MPKYHGTFNENLDARCFSYRTSSSNFGERSKNHRTEKLGFLSRGKGAIFRGHVGAEPSFFRRHGRFLRPVWRVGAGEFQTLVVFVSYNQWRGVFCNEEEGHKD